MDKITTIALTKTELQLLKKSIDQPIPIEECSRLLRLQLVREIHDPGKPGYKPIGLGICKISDLGTDFLAYREQLRKDMIFQNCKLPIAVSFITTVVLHWLLPLLPTMLQWFANFL